MDGGVNNGEMVMGSGARLWEVFCGFLGSRLWSCGYGK